jgi:hypothetical protein
MRKKRMETAPTNRREFHGTVSATAAAAVALPTLSVLTQAQVYTDDIGPQGGLARAEQSEEIRKRVAEAESNLDIPHHQDNGDEALYPNKIGNYSKNLKHDHTTGEVDLPAYEALISALAGGRFSDFEALATNGHFGSANPALQRRLLTSSPP